MTLLSSYCFLSIIVSACAILAILVSQPQFLHLLNLRPSQTNRLLKWLFVLIIFSPFVTVFVPQESITIVSAQAIDNEENYKLGNQTPVLKYSEEIRTSLHSNICTLAAIIFLLTGFSFFAGRYLLHRTNITKIINRSFVIKSIGKVKILVSEDIKVPFAYRGYKKIIIVLPQNLLRNQTEYSIAVKHEFQHHKQGDTLASHLIYLFRSLFFWNPLVHLMAKRISEIEELACDESLVGRRRVLAREYCDCLVSVAQLALESSKPLAGTTSMATGVSARILKWRIISMKRYKGSCGRWPGFIVGIFSSVIITSVSIASAGLIQDRKITLVEAKDLVKPLQNKEFPVEINEAILEQLNYYVGTPRGREFIRKSLERKQQFENIFSEKLNQYNAPDELLAVALMESGFKNPPQSYNPQNSAGVWQFIPVTAKNYGLRVDDVVDERMDVTRETDAAMRLLKAMYLRFGDWRLAIVSYNAGERKVQKGIDELGIRDPWRLIKAGYGGDSGYLAKVMASILILKNPTLVE